MFDKVSLVSVREEHRVTVTALMLSILWITACPLYARILVKFKKSYNVLSIRRDSMFLALVVITTLYADSIGSSGSIA